MTSIWVNESPITVVEGAEPVYTITVDGVTSIAASPTAKIYKAGTDVTSTNMPTGSASASGNIITLPTIKNLVGGNVYVVVATFTGDGVKDIRKIMLIVQKPGDEQ